MEGHCRILQQRIERAALQRALLTPTRAAEALKDPNNLAKPDYLDVTDAGVVTMRSRPEHDSVPVVIDPQLIVEYYSGK